MNKIHLIPEQMYIIFAMYKQGCTQKIIALAIDTIVGNNNRSAILSLTERQTNFIMLETRFFFTHPYSPWKKGAVENSNKLIRQYIPKKTNFYSLNNLEIKQIQYKISNQ